MRSAFHLSASLLLACLSACETVPDELDRPVIATDRKAEDRPRRMEPRQSSVGQSTVQSDDIGVQDSGESIEDAKEDREPGEKLDDVRNLAHSTKTLAKIVLFAPILPFCYLSKSEKSRTDCQLGQ